MQFPLLMSSSQAVTGVSGMLLPARVPRGMLLSCCYEQEERFFPCKPQLSQEPVLA